MACTCAPPVTCCPLVGPCICCPMLCDGSTGTGVGPCYDGIGAGGS